MSSDIKPDWVKVYIALGSNMDFPIRQLTIALTYLKTMIDSHIKKTSSIYRSPAQGGPENQPEYYNQVIEMHTHLSPLKLLKELQAIEIQQGRVRTEPLGPRVIDLDILLYGNLIIKNSYLTVPHPEMTARKFVLLPLLEISQNQTIPGSENVKQALAAVSSNKIELVENI